MLTNGLMKIASVISENSFMKAVRNGLISMMPIMLIGSFTVLINNLPIQWFQDMMIAVFGADWKNFTTNIFNGTMSIMSIGILVSISYSLSRNTKWSQGGYINPIIICLVSLGCLVTITDTTGDILSFTWTGATGLFVAIFTALLSTSLFFLFYRFRIFKFKMYTDASDSLVVQAFSSVEPAVLTFLVFSFIRLLFSWFGIDDIQAYIYDVFKQIFIDMSSSVVSAVIFVFSTQIFWFFGLHGNNVLENVAQEIWIPMLDANILAISEGRMPTEIFAKQFFDVFVFMGGSGATLCLIAALLIASKKTNASKLTRFSIPLGIFNINETLVYGLPVLLNPFYFIPFLLVPILLTITSFVAFSLGLVPLIVNRIQWTTPIILGGYVATNSWKGAFLQIFNLVIGTLFYIPFVRMAEKYKEQNNLKTFQSLVDQISYVKHDQVTAITSRMDDVGILSRVIANDIQNALNTKTGFYLVYQPQIDTNGNIAGCEALLRWNHPNFGMVPPPVTVSIAEESGCSDQLTYWVITEAVRHQKQLNNLGYDFIMSINISPAIFNDSQFVGKVQQIFDSWNIDPSLIEFEVTENIALTQTNEIKSALNALKKIGVKLAIDDFGMGHSSLLYIRTFQVDTLKLDGSLVEDILTDSRCSEIISAIAALSENMHIKIVAEMVETEAQRDALTSLGCHIFQGWYYAKAMEYQDLVSYLKENQGKNLY